jgi:hypothetical protein
MFNRSWWRVCQGELLGHEDDHGPQDHGYVAVRQSFVAADGYGGVC